MYISYHVCLSMTSRFMPSLYNNYLAEKEKKSAQ